jgi:hypothetical protein
MLIMGWDGTEVTPQIRHLIEDHHLGSILLTAKNLKCCFPFLFFFFPSPFPPDFFAFPPLLPPLSIFP